MASKKNQHKPIDEVTIARLDMVLRMCNIEIDRTLLDKIIDAVELIEDKGENTSIKDVIQMKSEWIKFQNPFGGAC